MSQGEWVLETALTQEECVRRLKSSLLSLSSWTQNPEKPFYGTVTNSGFALQFTYVPMARSGHPLTWGSDSGVNPYRLEGVFIPGAARTTIRATYRVEPAYWLLVAIIASSLLFGWWLAFRITQPSGLLTFFGITLLFVLYASWRIGRSTRQYLLPLAEPTVYKVATILDAQIRESSDDGRLAA